MGWSSPILVKVESHDELIYNGSHQVKGYNPETGEEQDPFFRISILDHAGIMVGVPYVEIRERLC